jgi:TRAP-type C4-dicarboxylate transport system substrate-binding protein
MAKACWYRRGAAPDDYASETGHILLVNFQVVSSQWFDGLPQDYQAALVEECRLAGQETSEVVKEAAAEAKATLQERGMTIVEDVDLAAFREAGEKAYEALNLVEDKSKVQAEIGK